MRCPTMQFDANGTCATCVKGMICDSPGTELETVALETGYYRLSASTAVVRSCPFGEASCPFGECATGYEGVLCASCARGYHLSIGKCELCDLEIEKIVASLALLDEAVRRARHVAGEDEASTAQIVEPPASVFSPRHRAHPG